MDYKRWDDMTVLERYEYCADWLRYHSRKLEDEIKELDFDGICFEFSEVKHYVESLEKLIRESEKSMDYGERWDE